MLMTPQPKAESNEIRGGMIGYNGVLRTVVTDRRLLGCA